MEINRYCRLEGINNIPFSFTSLLHLFIIDKVNFLFDFIDFKSFSLLNYVIILIDMKLLIVGGCRGDSSVSK